MKQVEVFFDYTCPFCYRAHLVLDKMLENDSSIALVWRPCEAHPRPESHGLHSDLCIRGMFYAQDKGVDLQEYHARMYQATQVDRINIEDIDVLGEAVAGLLDVADFTKALRDGAYTEELAEANSYAYEKSEVWVLPSYRSEGKKLDSAAGIGVTEQQLAEFLQG